MQFFKLAAVATRAEDDLGATLGSTMSTPVLSMIPGAGSGTAGLGTTATAAAPTQRSMATASTGASATTLVRSHAAAFEHVSSALRANQAACDGLCDVCLCVLCCLRARALMTTGL